VQSHLCELKRLLFLAFSFAFFNASAYEQETVEKVKTLLQVANFWHFQFLEGSQKKKNNDFFLLLLTSSHFILLHFVFSCRPSA